MRDILLGCLTWILTVGTFIGMHVLLHNLWGPPMADRGRSAAYVGGGGALFISTILLLFCAGIIYDLSRRG